MKLFYQLYFFWQVIVLLGKTFLVPGSMHGAFFGLEKLYYALGNICRKAERALQAVLVHRLPHPHSMAGRSGWAQEAASAQGYFLHVLVT